MAHAIRPVSRSYSPASFGAGRASQGSVLAAVAEPAPSVDLAALLDLLPIGVLVVDADLGLRQANTRAQVILERRDALLLSGGRLAAALPTHDAVLKHTVAAARAARGEWIPLAVPSLAGDARIALTARLLEAGEDPRRTLVALSLVEERIARPASMRGLSRRRREVLERLLTGERPEFIARGLGLSEHTVRAYVKDLHRHFGAHSRGELLARFIPSATA